jgi:hypothetical protein
VAYFAGPFDLLSFDPAAGWADLGQPPISGGAVRRSGPRALRHPWRILADHQKSRTIRKHAPFLVGERPP